MEYNMIAQTFSHEISFKLKMWKKYKISFF